MIETLITSQTRRKLLKIFLNNVEKRFYIRELTRKTNENINSIRKELSSLEKIGLLKTERVANLQYFFANKDFKIFKELKSIFIKTDPVNDLILKIEKKAKDKFGKELSSIVLFGSQARYEAREYSDVDILVICKTAQKDWRKRDDTIVEIEKAGFEFGIPVHIELLTEEEFTFSVNEGAPLLFGLAENFRLVYDNGYFQDAISLFRKNMAKWGAKKIKNVWEVPELAIKV